MEGELMRRKALDGYEELEAISKESSRRSKLKEIKLQDQAITLNSHEYEEKVEECAWEAEKHIVEIEQPFKIVEEEAAAKRTKHETRELERGQFQTNPTWCSDDSISFDISVVSELIQSETAESTTEIMWVLLKALFLETSQHNAMDNDTRHNRQLLEKEIIRVKKENSKKNSIRRSVLVKATLNCVRRASDMNDPYLRQGAFKIGLDLASSRICASDNHSDCLVEVITEGLFDVWSATRKLCSKLAPLAILAIQDSQTIALEVATKLIEQLQQPEHDAATWKRQEGSLLGLISLVCNFDACQRGEFLDHMKRVGVMFLSHDQVSVREYSKALLQTLVKLNLCDCKTSVLHTIVVELTREIEGKTAYNIEGLLSTLEMILEDDKSRGISAEVYGRIPLCRDLSGLLGHEASTVRQACSNVIVSSATVFPVTKNEKILSVFVVLEELLQKTNGYNQTWQEAEGKLFTFERCLAYLLDLEISEDDATAAVGLNRLEKCLLGLFLASSPKLCNKKFELCRMSQQLLPALTKACEKICPHVLVHVWDLVQPDGSMSLNSNPMLSYSDLYPDAVAASVFYFFKDQAQRENDRTESCHRNDSPLLKRATRCIKLLAVLHAPPKSDRKICQSPIHELIAVSIAHSASLKHDYISAERFNPYYSLFQYLSNLTAIAFPQSIDLVQTPLRQLCDTLQSTFTDSFQDPCSLNGKFTSMQVGRDSSRSMSQNQATDHSESVALAKRSRAKLERFFQDSTQTLNRMTERNPHPTSISLIPFILWRIELPGEPSERRMTYIEILEKIFAKQQLDQQPEFCDETLMWVVKLICQFVDQSEFGCVSKLVKAILPIQGNKAVSVINFFDQVRQEIIKLQALQPFQGPSRAPPLAPDDRGNYHLLSVERTEVLDDGWDSWDEEEEDLLARNTHCDLSAMEELTESLKHIDCFLSKRQEETHSFFESGDYTNVI